MKTITYISVMLITLSLSACGEPVQKFKVTVMDVSNTPMKGVEVAAWFNKRGKSSPLESYKITGFTDALGLVELEGETVWYQTSVSAEPEGFYKSIKYDHWTIKREGNRWEPWPVEVNLIMKKIGNPIPMYALRCGSTKLFIFPEKKYGPYAFDLVEMDWVAPHGHGKFSDFILEGIRDDPSDKSHNPSGILKLTFSNPEDGIFAVDHDTIGGSLLRSPSAAPPDGYLSEWSFPNKIDNENPDETALLPEMVYVFRIRTKTDESGEIIESRYGKI